MFSSPRENCMFRNRMFFMKGKTIMTTIEAIFLRYLYTQIKMIARSSCLFAPFEDDHAACSSSASPPKLLFASSVLQFSLISTPILEFQTDFPFPKHPLSLRLLLRKPLSWARWNASRGGRCLELPILPSQCVQHWGTQPWCLLPWS